MNLQPLPIDAVRPEVVAAATGGGFVLVAPPGAGKTTRVPPALWDRVAGEIWVAQPRRVAARAAARRMASERGEKVGQGVGYQVRFDRVGGRHTRIWVVTQGILLRRLQADPLLEGIGAVLVDEVHERSLDADLAVAFLREVREARPELVVAAMSATVDPGPFASFLGAPVIRSEGRTFPVTVDHLRRPDTGRVEDRVAAGVRRMLAEAEGDVLVFLPGVREIHRTAERLTDTGVTIVPLYGDLAPDAQDRALQPGRERRVVLATNVAETSVTVPGVRIVVDSGLCRRPRRDPSTGLDRLDTVAISQASADQRAGRAGRTAPGRALRLWTERAHRTRDAFDPPEVARLDLAGPVLQILAWGADPETFRWLEPPPAEALGAAQTLLAALGATDPAGALTERGRDLARLPLHPRLGQLLLEGARLGHRDDAALAASILSERNRGFDRPGTPSLSDLTDRVDAVREQRIAPALRRVLLRTADPLRRLGGHATEEVERDEALGRAVLAGWPDRVVRRREPGSDRGLMVGGKGVRMHPDSAVTEAELWVAVSIEARPGEPDALVRIASAVERPWLATEAITETTFDAGAGAVRSRRVVLLRDLVLASHPVPVDDAAAPEVLAEAARTRLSDAMPPHRDFETLRGRLRFLASREGDPWTLDWAGLLPELCRGRLSLAALQEADWAGAVRDTLGWTRWSELGRRAPTHVEIPSGRRAALDWGTDPPVLAVRMQELFGSERTPTVDDGRVPVLLHLLAPNGRPQQITDDLAGFWVRTWPEVRKELRARYPRHAWPEDPVAARPERRPGRRRGR